MMALSEPTTSRPPATFRWTAVRQNHLGTTTILLVACLLTAACEHSQRLELTLLEDSGESPVVGVDLPLYLTALVTAKEQRSVYTTTDTIEQAVGLTLVEPTQHVQLEVLGSVEDAYPASLVDSRYDRTALLIRLTFDRADTYEVSLKAKNAPAAQLSITALDVTEVSYAAESGGVTIDNAGGQAFAGSTLGVLAEAYAGEQPLIGRVPLTVSTSPQVPTTVLDKLSDDPQLVLAETSHVATVSTSVASDTLRIEAVDETAIGGFELGEYASGVERITVGEVFWVDITPTDPDGNPIAGTPPVLPFDITLTGTSVSERAHSDNRFLYQGDAPGETTITFSQGDISKQLVVTVDPA